MKKTVKVKRHNRSDGVVVEAHDRTIDVDEEQSLSESIKKRKREKEQTNLLATFLEER